MADRPLRPATDRGLGEPLPHQLPNRTRVQPSAINLSRHPKASAYAVLAPVSRGCPPPKGKSPRVTHPFATLRLPEGKLLVRLACVKPAASVRPEPGSNSQIVPKPNAQTKANKCPSQTPGLNRNAHCTNVEKKRLRSNAIVHRRPRFSSQSQCQRAKIVKKQNQLTNTKDKNTPQNTTKALPRATPLAARITTKIDFPVGRSEPL